jgi:glycosyltransferase involved in cell wall biosynthesis
MKDILIITSYFPPESGAASNRIFHLAEGLQKHNYDVGVLTPLPNYPTGKVFENYKGKFRHSSIENHIKIHRLWIYASNSKNKVLRLIAMLSYSFSLVWFFIWNPIPKKVIVQSPPLLVAFTCMLFLKSKKRQLILNVSDLWPIAGLELGAFNKNFSYKMLERIEFFNYKHANMILGQSDEILNHIETIIPDKKLFLYRNYPDFEVQKNTIYQPSEGRIKIVYAGLLGIAQGIYRLIQELDYSTIELHIYGAGAEQQLIEDYIKEHPELPLYYYGELSRNDLHKALLNYDIAIIPLLNRIYGSVPSKLFEYARLGLPMLYFGGGEGEMLMKKYALGWIAEAGDYQHLNLIISSIKKQNISSELREKIKKTAETHFDFGKQLKQLVEQF